tara:strand:- start:3988 stop:5613 length:1626 start_codon:yes stop_codon:yes gene_type:complete
MSLAIKVFRTILVSGVALLAVACAPLAERTVTTESGGLSFFHLNDTYRIDAVEDGAKGGFGRVTTLLREARADGREPRVLHAGDFLYPSLESQLWDGLQMIDAMNFMHDLAPMLVVIGNHETDSRNPQHLIDAVRASKFDWLGDNYRFSTGAADVDDALHSRYMLDYAGKKIGVLSLTMHPDDGGNDRDYLSVDGDYKRVAERVIGELEQKGADLIIGLTHLHLWEDKEIAALKAQHPTFRLIVGGHEHEPEFIAETANSAAIAKGASNARTIWRIDIDVDEQGELQLSQLRPLALDESVASDADYDLLAGKWRSRMLEKFPFITARVGEAALPMDAREVSIRERESSWGNFIVDQMRRAFGEPAADLAFLNSGTLRLDDYVVGDVRFEDIGRTFGFSSYLRHLQISGAEFRELLEAGYRGFAPSQGYFPQVSGFRVCVDRSRPEFERIVSLQVPAAEGWQEIDPDRDYSLVVSDFVYGGGDGYVFPEHIVASRPASELKYLVLDAIMAAQSRGEKVGVAVDPANPRIVILGSPDGICWPD